MSVSSGIKQGCTGSTSLLKLITCLIITLIVEEGKGFKNVLVKIVVLFFADDVLVIAENQENVEFNIRKVIDIGRECGLDINRGQKHHTYI